MEESNKKNKTKNAIVETYAEDMARVIGDDTQGLVKKIIHEEEQHEQEKNNLSPESKKNKFFMFVSIFLMILSASLLVFFLSKEKVNTVSPEVQFTPLIFTDKSAFFEVSGFKKDEIFYTISNEVNNTTVKIAGVEGIYLTENKQVVGLRRFISLTKSSFVPNSDTAFVSDSFLMGAVLTGLKASSPTAGDFFLLLKMRSTGDIFDSLRLWEGKMLNDLHGFLGINITGETNYLLTKSFENAIVENKNARVLYDKEGAVILEYIFVDDNSVIITNSNPAAHELIVRLSSRDKKQ